MLPIWKKLASWLGKIHHMDFSDELQWSPSQKQTSWHGWLTMLILFVMNFNGTYHKTNQVDIGNLITLISVMNSNGARHKNRQVDLGNFTMLIFLMNSDDCQSSSSGRFSRCWFFVIDLNHYHHLFWCFYQNILGSFQELEISGTLIINNLWKTLNEKGLGFKV